MQALVLTLAIVRFFLLGTLELSNQINRITGHYSNITVLMSAFSYLVFGQVIDNSPQSRQKAIFCTLELSLGLWFIITAGLSFYDAQHNLLDHTTSLYV